MEEDTSAEAKKVNKTNYPKIHLHVFIGILNTEYLLK